MSVKAASPRCLGAVGTSRAMGSGGQRAGTHGPGSECCTKFINPACNVRMFSHSCAPVESGSSGGRATIHKCNGSVRFGCGFETAVPVHAVRFLRRFLRFGSRFLAVLKLNFINPEQSICPYIHPRWCCRLFLPPLLLLVYCSTIQAGFRRAAPVGRAGRGGVQGLGLSRPNSWTPLSNGPWGRTRRNPEFRLLGLKSVVDSPTHRFRAFWL